MYPKVLNTQNLNQTRQIIKTSSRPNSKALSQKSGKGTVQSGNMATLKRPPSKTAGSKKKDTWKADLYEYLMGLFATALKALEFVVPKLGTAVSKAVGAFAKLNPFK